MITQHKKTQQSFDTLNNTRWIKMVDVAMQCPLSGGRPVYHARNILAFFDYHYTYNDSLMCTMDGYDWERPAEEGLASYNTVEIYPNPAQHYIQISGTNLSFVALFDVQGRKLSAGLHSQDMSENQTVVLDVSSYAAGTYFVHVYFADGANEVFSIIVAK